MSAITISPAPGRGMAARRGTPRATVLEFPVARAHGHQDASPVSDAGRPASLRLTRRGRLVLRLGAAVLALVALVAVVALQSGRATAGDAVQSVPVAGYRTVLPGETLWGIAREVAPGQDPRETIARITELNAMPSSGVRAGERLAIPVLP